MNVVDSSDKGGYEMIDIMNSLQEILRDFDNETEKFSERDVASAINRIERQEDFLELPIEFSSEIAAFEFRKNYPDDNTGWGTYYGPMIPGSSGNGTYSEYPSIKWMTSDILAYWNKRASEAEHPILKARYADLVWDLSKVVANASSYVQMAYIAIDSRLEIALQDLHSNKIDTIEHLRRALVLAISLNDHNRIEKVRDTIIAYEDKVAEDDKAGLWGFSYDLLVGHKKVSLPKDVEEKIIRDLENRLDRLTQPTDDLSLTSHRRPAQAVVTRLTSYYHRRGHTNEVRRVLLKYYEGFRHLVASEASLIVSHWLQEVYSTFKQYRLNEEAEAIVSTFREVWARASDEMATHSFEMEVRKEELDQYLDSLLADGRESATVRVAVHFIPKRDEAENQVRQHARDHPVLFLFPKQILDYEGRPIASIGSIEDDLEDNVVHHVSQTMIYSAFFLRNALAAFIERFEMSTQDFLDHIYTSPIFGEDKQEIIRKGIEAYLQGDSLSAVHLLIPQIEASIRNLAELLGIATVKERNEGMQYKPLGSLLRERLLEDAMVRDASWYFRILLTDQCGWNLRNDVSHGLLPHEQFSQGMADRVFHVLLLLGLIRENPIENGD